MHDYKEGEPKEKHRDARQREKMAIIDRAMSNHRVIASES